MQTGYLRSVFRTLARDPVTTACLAVLALLFLSAIAAPWLPLEDPTGTNAANRLQPIGSPGHLLGTDELGRDMLSRLVHAGRLSLFMGVAPVAIALVAGGILGIVAGYAGGRVNMLIMRLTDVFYAFPSILLAIGIAGSLGPGITNIVMAITIVFIPQITRITESATTQVRSMDFVDAARASGVGAIPIMRVHILRNVIGPVLVYATSLISLGVLIAAGLSFLGLGAAPPAAEWGLMLNTLRQSIYVAPWIAVLPGVMIFVTSMCFNLLSDGLRSALDVRM